MLANIFANVRSGAARGIVMAVLTGLISPLLIDGMNLWVEVTNGYKPTLPFLTMPELFLIVAILSFTAYLAPCIVVGAILARPSNRSVLAGVAIVSLISGVASYVIWTFAFRAFRLEMYAPALIVAIALFHAVGFQAFHKQ